MESAIKKNILKRCFHFAIKYKVKRYMGISKTEPFAFQFFKNSRRLLWFMKNSV